MQTIIRFGNITPEAPVSFSVHRSDIDSNDTGRSETGVLYRNRIRAGVYKLQVAWRVNKQQLAVITSAISADSFSVTFFDPTSSAEKTCTMYAGDRSAALVLNGDSAADTLWDLTVNFVEF